MLRRFGIELELVAPRAAASPLEHSRQVMESAGVTARENSHYGRAYDRWQAKPDGSLQPYGRCVEVVSRIMPASEASYEEVERVVNALDAAGYGVNRTCGFHVHLNVADLTLRQRLLVALRYAKIKTELEGILPPSRRANSYCQALNPTQQQTLATLIRAHTPAPETFGTRYLGTNLAWVGAAGADARIEFRQAAGTCNAAKVIGWVRFLQDLVNEVVRVSNGVDFVAPPIAPEAPEVRTAVMPGRAPRMRAGSHIDLVLTRLRTSGVVSTSWARETHGIAPHVLRSIISGLRRHGAQIETHGAGTELEYRLPPALLRSIAVGVTPSDLDIFVTRTTITETVANTPASRRATRPDPAALMTYPMVQGLSAASLEWVRQRRAVFAEDLDSAAA